jgi:hypothetical protein
MRHAEIDISGVNFKQHHLFQLPHIMLLNLEMFDSDFAEATPGAIG